MGILKPCPVCGSDKVESWEDEGETVMCVRESCGFGASFHHWQKLSRTNWVSVETRLFDAEGVALTECSDGVLRLYDLYTMRWEHKTYHLESPVRWLDSLPPIPTGKDQ